MPRTGRRRVLLADFGIARYTDDTQGLTATNITLGTVTYAPPEQLLGKPVSGQADQYALAATAYQLLSGAPPFVNTNPAVVIGQHLNAPPPPLGKAALLKTRYSAAVFDQLVAAYLGTGAGIAGMHERGLPVRAIPPQGAIYLSAQFRLHGLRLPGGQVITTNEQIRSYLLESGMAVVPFQAFGMKEETGWMRLSVGAVSVAEIQETLPRIEAALQALQPA